MRVVRPGHTLKTDVGTDPLGELGGECRLPRTTVRRRVVERCGDTFAVHLCLAFLLVGGTYSNLTRESVQQASSGTL